MKNNRTFLDKLLDGAEVKWMPLNEVANIANNARKPVKSSLRISGNIPYYGANNIQDYVEGYTHDGEFVLIAEDGSASLENYSIQWAVGKFWANNHVHVVNGKEKLNNRFLYHYLTNMNFIPFLAGKERAKLTKAKLQQIPIPIPPLPVQTEIVKILDALAALSSELTSELILRWKQYEYYREKLLSEEKLEKSGGDWKYLTQVANLTRGRVISKGYISDNVGDYPVYSSQTVNNGEIGKINSFDFNGEFVSWTTDGANAGTVFYRSGKFSITNVCGLIKIKNSSELNYKFLFYWLSIEAKKHVYSGMGNPKLMSHQMEKIKIPIPPLSVQTKIVKILDKFETLTNSITEGLPLAIEQSQKRYEYYRELLLNFPGRE